MQGTLQRMPTAREGNVRQRSQQAWPRSSRRNRETCPARPRLRGKRRCGRGAQHRAVLSAVRSCPSACDTGCDPTIKSGRGTRPFDPAATGPSGHGATAGSDGGERVSRQEKMQDRRAGDVCRRFGHDWDIVAFRGPGGAYLSAFACTGLRRFRPTTSKGSRRPVGCPRTRGRECLVATRCRSPQVARRRPGPRAWYRALVAGARPRPE
jgi:hypothetical protein